ncbi:hypothetical protein HID58_048645 [Brassica napus]|uniref:RNase H type-1 domain-containing protein n=1 Tax=Brassica napus TaxID=3708 RepID=A0ABQ8B3J6_BRANA|nr:hypothetical protein HID58_048645 [Brassica napus]
MEGSSFPGTELGVPSSGDPEHLLVEHTGFWNSTMLKRTFAEDDVHRILAIQARPSHPDSLRWVFTPFGSYTSKSEAPLSIPTILPGPVHYLVWKKPRAADLKCNVASSWINWQSQSGASSILRNDRGETLLHSSRAYANPVSEIHAALLSLLWAVESMMHLRQRRVIFEFSLAGLRDALSLPESYPQFLCLFEDLQSMLNRMDSWCLCLVSPTENRASESIARSVTRDNRSQSYVAQNGPVWLTTILQADAMGTL